MESSPDHQRAHRTLVSQLTADPYVWLLALIPLYLLFVSSNWIFSSLGSIDAWVYHGFFRNLQEYKAVLFPGTYYGSRLSWILPGYLVYKLLPPLAANYVLHLGLWYTGVFALYFALRSAAGRPAALITAVFLGSHIHFLQPVGSDYVDGPANVYFLVCFAFLTVAASRRRNALALAFAGAAYAAVVYTNLFTIVLAPVIGLYFALLSHRYQRAQWLRLGLSIAWFGMGFVALTALLGLANFLIEGSFAFYMPSVYYVLANAAEPNPWRMPLAQWINQAEWLVLPCVVAVSVLAALGSARFRASLFGPAAAGGFLLALAMMLFCEWRGVPVLQYSYYASYLIPPAFLAVGALLAGPLEHWAGAGLLLLAVVVLAVLTLPMWGYGTRLSQLRSETWPYAPLVLGALFAVGVRLPSKIAGWAMIPALVGCILGSSSIGYAFAERHAAGRSFARIAQAADTIDAVRKGEFPWFWYSRTDPHFDEFHALHSTYLWGYTMIGDEFPAIKPGAVIADGALLVIPTSDGEVLSRAREALHPWIFTVEPLSRREVAQDQTSYSLWFARIRFDSSRLEPLRLQPCPSGDCSELVSSPQSPPVQLPLGSWIPAQDPQTRVENQTGQVVVTTPLQRGGFAVKYGPLVAAADGRCVFKLQYRLVKGGIAFGARPLNESSWLARASIPVSQPGERTAVLSLDAEAGQPFWLEIANDHPLGDHASQYAILELEAYRFPADSPGD